MKDQLKRVLPARAVSLLRALLVPFHIPLFDVHMRTSYSLEGEDRLLAKLIPDYLERPGFYVDVGAYHPRDGSNTYVFYRAGWRGLNIEATPGRMSAFRRDRPRDINVEAAVSDDPAPRNFYLARDDAAINTFDPKRAQWDARRSPSATLLVTPVALITLLRKHVPADQEISFLDVDVEGHDLEVLRSNDWAEIRPRYVLAEVLGTRWADLAEHPMVLFMAEQRYKLVAKTVHTLFFQRD